MTQAIPFGIVGATLSVKLGLIRRQSLRRARPPGGHVTVEGGVNAGPLGPSSRGHQAGLAKGRIPQRAVTSVHGPEPARQGF